jgi:hypothetical protein
LFGLTHIEISLPVTKDGKPIFNLDKKDIVESFTSSYDTITMSSNERTLVPLNFLPFHMGLHICRLCFVDDRAGEFAYEVNVTVGLPDSLETVKVSCEERSSIDKQLVITQNNPQFAQALGLLQKVNDEMESSVAQKKAKKVAARTAILESQRRQSTIMYKVECSSYFSAPSEFLCKFRESDTSSQSNHANGNKVTVNFHPTNPGVYHSRLLLYSPYDIRIYDLEGIAIAKSTIQAVDFSCPARQTITQLIPLNNATKNDWLCKVSLKQDMAPGQSKCFSGPTEFLAQAGKVSTYPLVFKPQWIGQVQ